MFTLKHQDGDIQFEIVSGGFTLENSLFYLSVETRAVDKDAFPDSYLFAIDGFPIEGELTNTIINISTNPSDEPPNVYVYTTFHACEVNAEVRIEMISDKEISVSFEVVSEDVNYYNEKAKPNSFIGKATLCKRMKDELWIPV